MKRLQIERQYWVLKKAFEDLQKDHGLCESLVIDLKKDKDNHELFGSNFKLSEIQAAFLLTDLERSKIRVTKRNLIAKCYQKTNNAFTPNLPTLFQRPSKHCPKIFQKPSKHVPVCFKQLSKNDPMTVLFSISQKNFSLTCSKI